MKKLIAFALIIAAGFFGYKHFYAKSEIPEGVDKTRYTTCTICKGNSACWYCNGDAFRDGRRCGNCDGTGKCTNCLGAGKYMVYVIDGRDYVECGACHKKGACDLCDGAGIKDYGSMFGNRIIDNCQMCKGSGHCTRCKGYGFTALLSF